MLMFLSIIHPVTDVFVSGILRDGILRWVVTKALDEQEQWFTPYRPFEPMRNWPTPDKFKRVDVAAAAVSRHGGTTIVNSNRSDFIEKCMPWIRRWLRHPSAVRR